MAIVGAVMNGIGLGVGAAGLALQIIDFALGNLPKNSAPQGATVRIKAGLGDQNSYQLGGGKPPLQTSRSLSVPCTFADLNTRLQPRRLL